MLQLNIKSKNYMCLDIDPDSVIHKHLVKKVTDLTNKWDQGWENPILSSPTQDPDCDESHKLTMLPSFHISLAAPPPHIDPDELKQWVNETINERPFKNILPIIGDITLAPILISKKDNKKSAWVPLDPYWLNNFLLINAVNLDDFDSFDHRCDECPVQHLHVSIANLTGEPQDSIARPENCIIDTITA